MWGNLFMGMQGFGLGAETVGAYYTAKAEKSNLQAQASMDELNASLAQRQRDRALAAGRQEKQMSQLRNAQTKSSQRVALAANGVDLSSDTAVNILTTTDWAGEVDAKNIELNALQTAFGYETNATNYRNSAMMKQSSAKGLNPWLSAGTTLLGRAGATAQSYVGLKSVGAFDTKPSPKTTPGRPAPVDMNRA
jgi:hypothetical protein